MAKGGFSAGFRLDSLASVPPRLPDNIPGGKSWKEHATWQGLQAGHRWPNLFSSRMNLSIECA